MRCPTCDHDNTATIQECPTCHTPVGAPVLRPDVQVRPVRGIGRATAVAVGVATLGYLLTVLALPVSAAITAEAGRRLDADLVLTADLLQTAAGLPYLVGVLTAAVLMIIWTWRAFKNLDAFPGAGGQLSDGWAIAGWLVPFANFVVPYRVVANIARDSLWRLSTPGLVKLWWGAWLVFLFGDWYVGRNDLRAYLALASTPRTSAQFQAYTDYFTAAIGPYAVVGLACAVAGTSLIVLIHRISAAQEARIARASSGPVLPGSTVSAPIGVYLASPPAAPAAGGTIGA